MRLKFCTEKCKFSLLKTLSQVGLENISVSWCNV